MKLPFKGTRFDTIRDAEGYKVAFVGNTRMDTADIAGVRNFIVRACNSHGELLRELSHLVRLLEPLEQEGTLNVPGIATLNGAREAIDKAEGKS